MQVVFFLLPLNNFCVHPYLWRNSLRLNGRPAGATGPTVFAPPASIVGNTFVSQYYNILHQSPGIVHRFYTDASRLSWAEAGPNGVVDTVTTQAGIHEKVMSSEYGDIHPEIRTIDSQESLNGSVLVMVTGTFYSQTRGKRNFVQTFFLAPQDKGFFVLNDMFRYLDGDAPQLVVDPPSHLNTPPPALMNALTEAAEELIQPAHSPNEISDAERSAPANEDVKEYLDVWEYPPSESGEGISGDENRDVSEQRETPEPEQSFEEVTAHQQTTVPEPIRPEEGSGDLPKKSYASILLAQKDSTGVPSAPLLQPASNKNVSAQIDRAMPSSQTMATQPQQPPHLSAGAVSSSPNMDDTIPPVDSEGNARSIYVKNLPMGITEAELEREFGRFGKLKVEGINLRNQKAGVCFAFIDYEEASSCQGAIEASPIQIRGRSVYVEEKRQMAPWGGVGRGRSSQGRGYNNQGMRGRGGRSYGHTNGQDSDKFSTGRGRGGWRRSLNTYD